MISEQEYESTLSRMNTLKAEAETLLIERNALNQCIRILASQGKIDPAKETDHAHNYAETNH